MTDPFVGKLTYLRVYSGSLDSGSYIMNAVEGQEGAHRPPSADALEPARRHRCLPARATSCAVVGLKDVSTGDTLCDEKHPIILESMEFADPVIDIAVEPKTKAEPGQDGRGAAEARRGGPDVPRVHEPRDRPDHHRRHGRAAPRDHRRPPAARVQGRGQRGQAPGCLPRAPRQGGHERRGQVRAPDRRSRPVRPCGHQHVPAGGRRRLPVREQDRGRRACRRSTSPPSTRASRRR